MPSTRAKGGCWIFRSEMITELMIILTVVGAGIVLFVWTGSRRRRNENFEQEEVAESTAKFKQELEHTANEIIGRMENHIWKISSTTASATVRSWKGVSPSLKS